MQVLRLRYAPLRMTVVVGGLERMTVVVGGWSG